MIPRASLRLPRTFTKKHNQIALLADLGALRYFTPTMTCRAKLQPAKRVAGRRQDVWYVADLQFCFFALRNQYCLGRACTSQ